MGSADVLSFSLQAFPRRGQGGRSGRNGQYPHEPHSEGTLRQHLPQLADNLQSRSDRCSLINQFTAGKDLESFKSSETRSGLDGWRKTMSESIRRGRSQPDLGASVLRGA